MQPWKKQSAFAKFLWVDQVFNFSHHSPERIAHLSPSLAFIDYPTSLVLLAEALHSAQLLSNFVRVGTQLSSAVSELQHDILTVQQYVGSRTASNQRFTILNPMRQKSLFYPLFRYPNLLSDYCRKKTDSELYPLLYLTHLYAVGIIVELSMPEVEFPTLARGLMVPMESTLSAIASRDQMSEGIKNLKNVDELVRFPLLVVDEFQRRGKGIMRRFI
jgi:hypothetical protein